MSQIEDRNILSKENCIVCDKQAEGIIRTFFVCSRHFRVYINDNKYRVENGIEISNDSKYYKRCYKDKCTKRILVDKDKMSDKIYCSERCKIKDQNVSYNFPWR